MENSNEITAVIGFMSENQNFPAATKGEAYKILSDGLVGGDEGRNVEAGDLVLAVEDNEGGTEAAVGASWLTLKRKQAPASTKSKGKK